MAIARLSSLFRELALRPNGAVRDFVDLLISTGPSVKTHPLGFLQTVFSEDAEEYRLNFWGTSFGIAKTPDWQIHTHRFDFSSTIILGRLRETIYTVTDDPVGEFEIYDVQYFGGVSRLQGNGRRSKMRVASEKIFAAGYTYKTDSYAFHRTDLLSNVAVSLMQIGASATAPARVLGAAAYDGEFPKYVPQTVAVADVADALLRTHSESEAPR